MKNRRNTRRGRAKRWTLYARPGCRTMWGLRGLSGVVVSDGGEWVIQTTWPENDIRRRTRAAAMKAAEHLARSR